MNRRLLPILASAAVLVAGWSVLAFTCDEKATTAQATTASTADVKGAAKSSLCTAEMAAKCTAAQAAACKAKGAKTTAVTASAGGHDCSAKMSAASVHECAAHQTSAAAMAHECSAHKTSAVMAPSGSEGCSAHLSKAAAKPGHSCEGMTSAQAAACPHGKGMQTASAKADCGGAAMAGFSSGVDAVVAGGPGCKHHGSMTTAEQGHHNCDACADMAQYDDEIRSAGGQTQVVRLKNGVMFIHTADTPSHVRAVQAAMTRRSDRLMALTSAGDRAKLCPDCKAMRGAMASGKLNREIVTIEGGCLTLMTSNDRAMVAKLHALAGNEMARKS